MQKGTHCLLKILKKKGVEIEIRRPNYLLRNLRVGDIVKAQWELLAGTTDGHSSPTKEDCFWVPSLSAYVYFPLGTVEIYERVTEYETGNR